MFNENDMKTSNAAGLSGTESPVKSPVTVPLLSEVRGRTGAKRLPKDQPTYVYVMTSGGRSKIGLTADLLKRKRQLQNASGLDIVLRTHRLFSSLASATAVEAKLHRRFSRWRQKGEWFGVAVSKVAEALHSVDDPQMVDAYRIKL